MLAVSGKCGRGLRSLARSAISWKLWPEPCEQLLRIRRIEYDQQLDAMRLVEAGIGQRHAGTGARQLHAAPRNVHGGRIRDRNHADGSGLAQGLGSLRRRLIVRRQGRGHVRRRTRDQHHHLALHIEAGKIVIVLLGNAQTISDKDQRRVSLEAPGPRAC